MPLSGKDVPVSRLVGCEVVWLNCQRHVKGELWLFAVAP